MSRREDQDKEREQEQHSPADLMANFEPLFGGLVLMALGRSYRPRVP
jgi:hypothetical protein